MAATLLVPRHKSDVIHPQVQWRDLVSMTRTEKQAMNSVLLQAGIRWRMR